MTFGEDVACLELIVGRDPSFGSVSKAVIETHLDQMRAQSDPDLFLLSAMALFALAGNGHTRVIPNQAIRVLPLRIVALGPAFVVTDAAAEFGEAIGGQIVAINGVSVDAVIGQARPYLAGTFARQHVIGGIVLAWPAALARLGVRFDRVVTYDVVHSREVRQVRCRLPGLWML